MVRAVLEEQEAALAAKKASKGRRGALLGSGDDASYGQMLPCECRELVVGGANGCWVVVRKSGPRKLFCVMESLAQDSFPAASEACGRFVQYNYKGLFDV